MLFWGVCECVFVVHAWFAVHVFVYLFMHGLLRTTLQTHASPMYITPPPLPGNELRAIVVRRLLHQLPKQAGSVPLGVLLSKHFDLIIDTGATVLMQQLTGLPALQPHETPRAAAAAAGGALGAAGSGGHSGGPDSVHSVGSRQASGPLVGGPSTTGTISADSVADWSRQLSSVFVKKTAVAGGGGGERVRGPGSATGGEY